MKSKQSARIASHWQMIDPLCVPLPDPRIMVSRQLGWSGAAYSDKTHSEWTGVEPDNYNLAIFDTRPHDFKFIQNQCWYQVTDLHHYAQKFSGWFSLYVAEERLQTILFNREIVRLQPRAVWRFNQAKLIRQRQPLLSRESVYTNRNEQNYTTEERLYQMGYFEEFANKYFAGRENDFSARIGQPRYAVLNPQQEAVDRYEDSA